MAGCKRIVRKRKGSEAGGGPARRAGHDDVGQAPPPLPWLNEPEPPYADGNVGPATRAAVTIVRKKRRRPGSP